MKFLICCFGFAGLLGAQSGPPDFLNHNRPVLDAHNCYPYDGKWTDRIDRALKTGFPVSIEYGAAPYENINFDFHTGQLVHGTGPTDYLIHPDHLDFGPRLGAAWQAIPNKLVVRAGWGMFYSGEDMTGSDIDLAAAPLLLSQARPAAGGLSEPGGELRAVVVLIRHGVRTPLASEIRGSIYNAPTWPTWPQAAGVLTEHGTAALGLMGAAMRGGSLRLRRFQAWPPVGVVREICVHSR
ncbi:MAG TPA: hypothetical protein VMB85_12410 [Bryobacteraceae bacterium]|nr:hypothetical protein [Bryobacteraceae bacterium]